MIRKFECKDCHHQFGADDQQWVECPKCHSDNVGDVARKFTMPELPEWAGKVVLGLIGVAILGGGGYFAYKHFNTPDEVIETTQRQAAATVEEYDDNANKNETEVDNTPRLVLEDKTYDDASSTYKFCVKVDFPPKNSWKLNICEFHSDKVVASSEDGNFDKVPCSKDEIGRYTIRLVDAESGTVYVESDQVGFDKQQKISKAWTAADLEKAINDYKKSMVDNPYIADTYEIVILNKDCPDMNSLKSFTEVQDRLRLNKECGTECSVKVEKVETDAQHRIVKASIRINEKVEDWMK